MTERGGRMAGELMFILSMVTKVALLVIAAGLVWSMGHKLWDKYRKPKD